MSQTDKPSLADIARKNNSARTSKFASSMVPTPPQLTPDVDAPSAEPAPATPLTAVIEQAEADFAEGRGTAVTADELRTMVAAGPVETPDPARAAAEPVTPTRPTRRRTAAMSLPDDILMPKAPDEEAFGKMTRIAEKHHELLRKIAYEHRKPMNTILYNLLEVLEQTYQRDQQKDV